MLYQITVKSNSKIEEVQQISDDVLTVRTHKSAHDGEANKDVIRQLSKFFKVPKTAISIVKGAKSKNKIIEIKTTML